RRDEHDNLALRFAPGGDGLQVGLLHCNAGDAAHAAYSPCTVEQLHERGLDYWALGHVHERRVLAREPSFIAYPGNLQGRSPRASERGAKGALVVRVAGGRVAEV